MPTSDTSEKGLESLIFNSLTGYGSSSASGAEGVRETGSVRYIAGDPKDYDRDHAVDIEKLLAFLETTQPKVFAQLGIATDGPARLKFLARLQGEIAKRGVVDVLRKGIQHGAASVDLFYGAPSPGNPKAAQRFEANLFSVTRQLRYSKDESQLSIDLAIFINGLPIITFELKNRLTKSLTKLYLTIQQRYMGEAVHLLELPDPEAACAQGRGFIQGYSGIH